MNTDKQREALIKERGEPLLAVDFDVFDNDRVSMWLHVSHSHSFLETKRRLELIVKHLQEFLRDGEMCPYKTLKNDDPNIRILRTK